MQRGLSLALVVGFGGTRRWRAITYRNGKPQSFKLGTYPQMSVREARAAALEYFENPRKIEQQQAVGTFHTIAENWFKRHVEENQLISAPEIKRQLLKYIYPKWHDHRFLDITRHDVNELLDQISDQHGRSMADAVLATLRSIMSWHQTRDSNYLTPIVKGMRRARPKARSRILTDPELRQLWEVEGAFGAFIKLLLLTAQRKQKVVTMKWDDLAGEEWTIASREREKGTAGKLKLPKLALEIIAAQPRHHRNPYVLAGHRGHAATSFAKTKIKLDAKLQLPPWTLHDLRRTARSLMSRAGVQPHIAERVLGHRIPGVEGIYDRHQYDAEKAQALNALAHLLETILDPPTGNVVVLPRKRRR